MPHLGNRPMTPPEWAMLLALSGVWGGAFFFDGIAVRDLPVLTVVVSCGGPAWAAFFGMGLLIAWFRPASSSGANSIPPRARPRS